MTDFPVSMPAARQPLISMTTVRLIPAFAPRHTGEQRDGGIRSENGGQHQPHSVTQPACLDAEQRQRKIMKTRYVLPTSPVKILACGQLAARSPQSLL